MHWKQRVVVSWSIPVLPHLIHEKSARPSDPKSMYPDKLLENSDYNSTAISHKSDFMSEFFYPGPDPDDNMALVCTFTLLRKQHSQILNMFLDISGVPATAVTDRAAQDVFVFKFISWMLKCAQFDPESTSSMR
jgi:hypothetical protein